MSITESDHQTDDWMNLNLDNDLQPESDKIFDSENCELLSESAHSDFMMQAEKGDGLDLLPECRKEEFKSEPEKGDYKLESEKGDFRTESEESDLESDKSQTGLDVFDRLDDIQKTGFLGGDTEADFPVQDESLKGTVTIRRFRGPMDSGLALTESTADQFLPEPGQTGDETALNQNEGKACKSSPFSSLTSGKELNRNDANFNGWIWYLAPKTICLVVMSLIYLGFSLLGIRMWSASTDNVQD